MSAERERAQAVLAYLRDRQEDMVDLVVALASLESPTDVPASQEAVQRLLRKALEGMGYSVRHISGRKTGGHIFAVPAHRVRRRPTQLLMGHSDTVWRRGTLRKMPVLVEDGILRGPGTFDMKSGLVQAIFALDALRTLGLTPPATPVFFVNSDEEIGSPESRRLVERLGRHVVRAFVLEPALGPAGLLKTARKGVARYRLTVTGKAAHSGLDPTGGASAIAELAHLITELHGMTDLDAGLTVNVGVIMGGTRPNVTAAEAHADVDVRVMNLQQGEAFDQALRSRVPRVPGTSVSVAGGIEVPPLERTPRNRALWHDAEAAAERLGIPIGEGVSGGGSDGNTTSLFTATLDGLGSTGDGAHATHEHVVVRSMPERAALLAELLMAPVAD